MTINKTAKIIFLLILLGLFTYIAWKISSTIRDELEELFIISKKV